MFSSVDKTLTKLKQYEEALAGCDLIYKITCNSFSRKRKAFQENLILYEMSAGEIVRRLCEEEVNFETDFCQATMERHVSKNYLAFFI